MTEKRNSNYYLDTCGCQILTLISANSDHARLGLHFLIESITVEGTYTRSKH